MKPSTPTFKAVSEVSRFHDTLQLFLNNRIPSSEAPSVQDDFRGPNTQKQPFSERNKVDALTHARQGEDHYAHVCVRYINHSDMKLQFKTFSCSYDGSSHATAPKRTSLLWVTNIKIHASFYTTNWCTSAEWWANYQPKLPRHIYLLLELVGKVLDSPVFGVGGGIVHPISQHTWKAQKPMKLTIGSVWSGRVDSDFGMKRQSPTLLSCVITHDCGR